jgi:hypothetical protein
MARVEEVRGAQMANQLRAMQMQQAQREEQQNELANRLYAESIGEGGEIDYGKLMQGMALRGMGSRIPGVLEQRAKTQSRASERQLREEQIRNQQIDAALKILRGANRENYSRMRAFGIERAPGLADVLPEEYDEPYINALANRIASEKKRYVVGGSLVSETGEELYRAPPPPERPPAPEAKTPTQREYETAVSQGYKGTILDFKRDVAAAGRAPVQPRPEPPPRTQQVTMADGRLGIVNMDTGVVTPSTVGGAPAMARPAAEGLTPKEQQNREAKFPAANLAVKSFEASTDTLIADLQKLSKHPGLNSITGIVAGRVPGITSEGRDAEALLNKILARGGFQELQNMRQASPTGGALGNVSNQEGTQLRQAFAALDRTQDAPSIRNAIVDAIQQLTGAKERVREAFDLTYEYRKSKGEGVPTGRQPSASGGGVDMNNPLLR